MCKQFQKTKPSLIFLPIYLLLCSVIHVLWNRIKLKLCLSLRSIVHQLVWNQIKTNSWHIVNTKYITNALISYQQCVLSEPKFRTWVYVWFWIPSIGTKTQVNSISNSLFRILPIFKEELLTTATLLIHFLLVLLRCLKSRFIIRIMILLKLQ